MIYSWHMPFFFSLVGMSLVDVTFRQMLWRTGSLLWVYFIVSFLLLPFGLFIYPNTAQHIGGTALEQMMHASLGVLYASVKTIRVVPLWFLPCLSLALSLAWFLLVICASARFNYRRAGIAMVALVLICFGACFLSITNIESFVWILDWGSIEKSGYFFTANVVPMAMGFIIFGAWLVSVMHLLARRTLLFSSVGLILAWISILIFGGVKEVELAYGIMDPGTWASVSAMLAIAGFAISSYLSSGRLKWLSSIGASTLPILVFHNFIQQVIASRGHGEMTLPYEVCGFILGLLLPWFIDMFILSKYRLGQFVFYPRKLFARNTLKSRPTIAIS